MLEEYNYYEVGTLGSTQLYKLSTFKSKIVGKLYTGAEIKKLMDMIAGNKTLIESHLKINEENNKKIIELKE